MRELLAVQAVDTSLDQARHALIHLPERAALTAAQAEAAAATAAQHEVRGRLDAVRKEQRRFEDEAATVEAKAQSMNDQLYGGGKSVRELEAIQADVESLKRRQGELEDRAIEKMEEAEPIEAEFAAATAALERLAAHVDSVDAALTVAIAECEAKIEALESERTAAVANVGDDLLATYEKLRPQLGGIAIAELVGGRCQGCHLTLSAVDLDQIRKVPDDEPVTCPECFRLLIRRSAL